MSRRWAWTHSEWRVVHFGRPRSGRSELASGACGGGGGNFGVGVDGARSAGGLKSPFSERRLSRPAFDGQKNAPSTEGAGLVWARMEARSRVCGGAHCIFQDAACWVDSGLTTLAIAMPRLARGARFHSTSEGPEHNLHMQKRHKKRLRSQATRAQVCSVLVASTWLYR